MSDDSVPFWGYLVRQYLLRRRRRRHRRTTVVMRLPGNRFDLRRIWSEDVPVPPGKLHSLFPINMPVCFENILRTDYLRDCRRWCMVVRSEESFSLHSCSKSVSDNETETKIPIQCNRIVRQPN